ncbi:MAG: response regulator [Microcoleaceae cyanobacterium]
MTRQVLIIDDEADIRELLQMTLETAKGWIIFTAASGLEGVEMAAQHQPDAIILDVMMPGIDGPTTVRKLQENSATQHIPVILLTAKRQANHDAQYSKIGVKAVLSKLVNPVNFPNQVAEILGWSNE